jgi:hypothetical protein
LITLILFVGEFWESCRKTMRPMFSDHKRGKHHTSTQDIRENDEEKMM